MVLGDQLAVGDIGTVRVSASAAGVSRIQLTGGNVYLGDGAKSVLQ